MKKILALVIIMILAVSAAWAEDFSKSLPRAGKWPGKLATSPGMTLKVAPTGAVTGVRFWNRGHNIWHAGANSLPMAVYAVGQKNESGIWWTPVRVYAYCSNPARGGWLERKPAPQIETKVVTKVVTEVLEISVSNPPPPEEAPRPAMIIPNVNRVIMPGQAINYPTSKKDSEAGIVPVAFTQRLEKKEVCPPSNPPPPPPPPPDPTCGPGTAPPPPPVSATTGVGDPSGRVPPPPSSDPNQVGPQANHGTGGNQSDPYPSHEHIAESIN